MHISISENALRHITHKKNPGEFRVTLINIFWQKTYHETL